MEGRNLAKQLMVDLYGCDPNMLNDAETLKRIAKELVESIGAKIVEEQLHLFEPIGITYFAIISTSHFSIHTWPEHGYCAVDLFSCSPLEEERITRSLSEYFHAKEWKSQTAERRISAE